MIRRIFLRKPLLAALALMMAAAPSVAQAGAYGTARTAPFQYCQNLGFDLQDVTITHYYGTTSETFHLGTIGSGQIINVGTVHFYTGGVIYAGDYWTITGWFRGSDGADYDFWRSLDHFDLTSGDANNGFSMSMWHGSYSYLSNTDMKLDFHSRKNAMTNLPVFAD